MKPVFLRTAHNYNTDDVSRETGLAIDPAESVVQQQFADDVDINTIVQRFGLTGELPNGIAMPVSGDFTKVVDFQTAMQLIRQSEEAFAELPAEMRAKFDNDPARLIAFLDDERNRDKAIEYGIIAKPPEQTRDVVQAVDELAKKLTASPPTT